MAITGIHHFNIRAGAEEVVALERFYCNVIGLAVGPRPPFDSRGTWLYAANKPLVHLTQMNSGEVVAPDSPHLLPEVSARRSAIDHVAFASSDLDAMVSRLASSGVPHTRTVVPETGEIQIFCRDPSGTGVELIFPLSTTTADR